MAGMVKGRVAHWVDEAGICHTSLVVKVYGESCVKLRVFKEDDGTPSIDSASYATTGAPRTFHLVQECQEGKPVPWAAPKVSADPAQKKDVAPDPAKK